VSYPYMFNSMMNSIEIREYEVGSSPLRLTNSYMLWSFTQRVMNLQRIGDSTALRKSRILGSY